MGERESESESESKRESERARERESERARDRLTEPERERACEQVYCRRFGILGFLAFRLSCLTLPSWLHAKVMKGRNKS